MANPFTAITTVPPSTLYPGGIDVAHSTDYFSKGIDAQGPYYRVEYYTSNYANADTLCNYLLGYTSVSGGTSGTIVRRGPHQHPLSPSLYCTSAEVTEGLGDPILNSNGLPTYRGGAKVRCEYRPWLAQGGFPVQMTDQEKYQQIDPNNPVPWCTQELDFTTETRLVPGRIVKWNDGACPLNGKPVGDFPVSVQIPITVMNLTFHLVPYMPVALQNYQGCVNSDTFLGSAAGTVLMKGARTVREWDSAGNVTQKVMLTYLKRTGIDINGNNQSWNRVLNSSDMGWYIVTPVPYQTATLSDTLTF